MLKQLGVTLIVLVLVLIQNVAKIHVRITTFSA